MSWVVAIPSYNRVDVLQEKTLAILKHYKIPKNRIYVFVADEEQKRLYSQIPKTLYGHLVVAEKGLREARNFITEYFPAGKPIVQMDDDVYGFDILSESAKLSELPSLSRLINEGFRLCKKTGLHLWGIAPVRNAFFMKDGYSTDVKFLIGHFWGVLNDKSFKLKLTYKEDYERTLWFSEKDGGVLRFNNVAAKTRMGAKGGLDTEIKERLRHNKDSSQYLMEQYPDYVRLNPRREGEILLKQPAVGGAAVRELKNEEDNGIQELSIRSPSEYEKAKEHLLSVLRETTIRKIVKSNPNEAAAVKKGIKKKTERGDVLGLGGRTMTLGYGIRYLQGYGEFAANKHHPELLKAIVAFGNRVVPKGWTYETITLNHNVKAKKHKDVGNAGDSVIIGIGDFTGGDIRVWDGDDKNPEVYPLHDQPLMFNGALHYHQTTPFKGERYTMIFYRQKRAGKSKGVTMKGKGEMLEEDDDLQVGGIFA